ncbi:MAG: acyl-CoA dehydrogenase family protein [Sulfuricaulis sp.]|nr:acyl-CoA dehydrogenase family protein [Sulfuricaulis sp.]
MNTRTDMSEDLNVLSDDAFRMRFRNWLEKHCPEDVRRPAHRLRGQRARAWFRLLHEHGWRAPAWPREHGGMGLSIPKLIIYDEELDRAQVSRSINFGDSHLGPTLIKLGTEEQRRHYLPRILSCEDWWCQGYSEPNAGSDLASLTTRAEPDGDHFIINGQKTWSSYAADATHVFLLVRTSTEAIKQKGITFILADMSTPGITVKPIINLAGDDDFCEVFYDNVRVPAKNVVGRVGDGWAVSRSLLGMERLFIGSPRNSQIAMQALKSVGEVLGISEQPEFAEAWAELSLELHALNCLYRETARALGEGRHPENELSMLKIVATEHFQRTTEAMLELAGEYGPIGKVPLGNGMIDIRQLYMLARPATIYGGSSEIQRNILSKRMLALPNA